MIKQTFNLYFPKIFFEKHLQDTHKDEYVEKLSQKIKIIENDSRYSKDLKDFEESLPFNPNVKKINGVNSIPLLEEEVLEEENTFNDEKSNAETSQGIIDPLAPLAGQPKRGDPLLSYQEEMVNCIRFRYAIQEAVRSHKNSLLLMQRGRINSTILLKNGLENITASNFNMKLLLLKNYLKYPRTPTSRIEKLLAEDIRQATYKYRADYLSYLEVDGRPSYLRQLYSPKIFLANGGYRLIASSLLALTVGSSIADVAMNPELDLTVYNVAYDFVVNNKLYVPFTYGTYYLYRRQNILNHPTVISELPTDNSQLLIGNSNPIDDLDAARPTREIIDLSRGLPPIPPLPSAVSDSNGLLIANRPEALPIEERRL